MLMVKIINKYFFTESSLKKRKKFLLFVFTMMCAMFFCWSFGWNIRKPKIWVFFHSLKKSLNQKKFISFIDLSLNNFDRVFAKNKRKFPFFFCTSVINFFHLKFIILDEKFSPKKKKMISDGIWKFEN